MKVNHDVSLREVDDFNPMDMLLAKLSEQQAVINKQHEALKTVDKVSFIRTADYVAASASNFLPITPGTDTFASTALTTSPPISTGELTPQPNADEVLHLKLELEAAKGKIARMDQELTQTRITKHTIEQAIGSASEADFPLNPQSDLSQLQHALNSSLRTGYGRDSSWNGQEDAHSDTSEALSAGGFNRTRAIWNNNGRQAYPADMPDFHQPQVGFPHGAWVGRGFGQQFAQPSMPFGAAMAGFRSDRLAPEMNLSMGPPGDRRTTSRNNGRFGDHIASNFPYAGSNSSYDSMTPASLGYASVVGATGSVSSPMSTGMGGSMGYQPQPIGTPLSPFAPEFTSSTGAWKNDVSRIRSLSTKPFPS